MNKVSEKILEVLNKENENFLRSKTQEFDFKNHTKSEIKELTRKMRAMMKEADGVGLSANQVGLPYRMFVAQVPDDQGHMKFYAVFNPVLSKFSKDTETIEEGCLSVPETFGPVERFYRVVLDGFNADGNKIKIKAWGLLARVFQHEVDHLDGKLFVDKAKELHKVEMIN
ncbi:peptide deformylase [Patescibacteria group bacterium]|nr:peptide deformylase [Patescibacteria group bacterium]